MRGLISDPLCTQTACRGFPVTRRQKCSGGVNCFRRAVFVAQARSATEAHVQQLEPLQEALVKSVSTLLIFCCWQSTCAPARAARSSARAADPEALSTRQVDARAEHAPHQRSPQPSATVIGIVLAAGAAVALAWHGWRTASQRPPAADGPVQPEAQAQLAARAESEAEAETLVDAPALLDQEEQGPPGTQPPPTLPDPPSEAPLAPASLAPEVELPSAPQPPPSAPPETAPAPPPPLDAPVSPPPTIPEPAAPAQELSPAPVARTDVGAAPGVAVEVREAEDDGAGPERLVPGTEAGAGVPAQRTEEADQAALDQLAQQGGLPAVSGEGAVSPAASLRELEAQLLVPALQDVSAEVSRTPPEVAAPPAGEAIPLPGTRPASPLTGLRMAAGGVTLGHPGKRDARGEDAFFVCATGLGAVGVADGVGSWIVDGIDAGDFSRLLMGKAAGLIEHGHEDGREMDARDILDRAHAATKDQVGSSTACIGIMLPEGKLQVANLGDSGFRIFRNGECVYQSEAQLHEFNMPAQMAAYTNTEGYDTADDATVYDVDQLEEGDLVIFATDGLFDNMWNDEMQAHIEGHLKGTEGEAHRGDLRQLARRLAMAAQSNAARKDYRSPFAVEKAKAKKGSLRERLFPRGGKLDDATVVAAMLTAAPLQA